MGAMLRCPNMPAPNWFCATRSIGLDHQVTIQLSSPVAATLAAPTTASLTASHLVRVTLCVHTSRCVPFSSSRATSGAAQNAPSSAGTATSAVASSLSSWSSVPTSMDAGWHGASPAQAASALPYPSYRSAKCGPVTASSTATTANAAVT